MRLTPEREQEIRKWADGHGDLRFALPCVQELLAEIDALRAEFKTVGNLHISALKLCDDVTKERDELKAYKIAALKELLQLKAKLEQWDKIYASEMREAKKLHEELDQLKGENAQLIRAIEIWKREEEDWAKENEELEEHRHVYNKNRKDLLEANQKLSERIKELEAKR